MMGFFSSFFGSDLSRLWREIDTIQPSPAFMLSQPQERTTSKVNPKRQDEAKLQISKRQRQSLRGQFRGR